MSQLQSSEESDPAFIIEFPSPLSDHNFCAHAAANSGQRGPGLFTSKSGFVACLLVLLLLRVSRLFDVLLPARLGLVLLAFLVAHEMFPFRGRLWHFGVDANFVHLWPSVATSSRYTANVK